MNCTGEQTQRPALPPGPLRSRLTAALIDVAIIGLPLGIFFGVAQVLIASVFGIRDLYSTEFIGQVPPAARTLHLSVIGPIQPVLNSLLVCCSESLFPVFTLMVFVRGWSIKPEPVVVQQFTSTYVLITICLNWLYHAGMESSPLQCTWGKMACHLRVGDREGARITFARASIRHIAKVLSWIPIPLFPLGLLMVFTNKRRRALHDLVAGSYVFRDCRIGSRNFLSAIKNYLFLVGFVAYCVQCIAYCTVAISTKQFDPVLLALFAGFPILFWSAGVAFFLDTSSVVCKTLHCSEAYYRTLIKLFESRICSSSNFLTFARVNLSNYLLEESRTEEALVIAREATTQAPEQSPFLAMSLCNLSRLLLIAGSIDESIEAANRAATILEQKKPSKQQALPLIILGKAYLDRGNMTESERAYSLALEVLRGSTSTRGLTESDRHNAMTECLIGLAINKLASGQDMNTLISQILMALENSPLDVSRLTVEFANILAAKCIAAGRKEDACLLWDGLLQACQAIPVSNKLIAEISTGLESNCL